MWAWGEHDPESDTYRANVAAFRYGPVGNESSEMAKALDMYGHHREAEKYLEPLLTMQGSIDLNARVTNGDGALYGFWSHYVFNTGFILWNGGIHYLFTRDSSWLTAMAPRIVKACDSLVEQRKTTMTRNQRGKLVLGYGFFPTCGLVDWPACFYWTITNAYFYQGMRAAGQVLAEINHPDAARIAREAEAYREDILRGIGEATVRCPVVKLQDGRAITRRVDVAKGDPRNPPTFEEISAKYENCTHSLLSVEDMRRSSDMILHLESISDVGELMHVLTYIGKTS